MGEGLRMHAFTRPTGTYVCRFCGVGLEEYRARGLACGAGSAAAIIEEPDGTLHNVGAVTLPATEGETD